MILHHLKFYLLIFIFIPSLIQATSLSEDNDKIGVLETKCHKADTMSCNKLAHIYDTGEIVKPDASKATKFRFYMCKYGDQNMCEYVASAKKKYGKLCESINDSDFKKCAILVRLLNETYDKDTALVYMKKGGNKGNQKACKFLEGLPKNKL